MVLFSSRVSSLFMIRVVSCWLKVGSYRLDGIISRMIMMLNRVVKFW